MMCLNKCVKLLGEKGVLKVGSKNQLDNLITAVQQGLMATCYSIIPISKSKFFNILKTEHYVLLENKGNVKLVKRYLPQFTSNLDIYLNTKDSKEKNESKRKMELALQELPKKLSEGIAATLGDYEIVL